MIFILLVEQLSLGTYKIMLTPLPAHVLFGTKDVTSLWDLSVPVFALSPIK